MNGAVIMDKTEMMKTGDYPEVDSITYLDNKEDSDTLITTVQMTTT